ncbi:putative zinc finger protein [Orchesella cincta]|uniref:Putative zinc finger protein n=1 Tax=Orchesella cincta TaxID=48709 RepID=A0A1D2M390_ORCCI|nr:putative zinc finger protein [Orchesella cincta]
MIGEDENGSFETLKTLFKKSHQHEETLDQLGPMFVLRVILGVPVKNLEISYKRQDILQRGESQFVQTASLGCNPVRDKVRLMASSGELDRDEDGCSTLLFDTNDDWLRRIVKQEQTCIPPEDSPHVDDNLNLEENESDRVVESESVTPKPGAGATSSRKLSKKVRKIKSNAEDSEESASDWEYDQAVERAVERREKYRNRPPRKRNTSSTSKQEKVKCPGCKGCFSDIVMRNHFNSVHSVALNGKYIQCNQCYLAFEDLRNLEIHIEITHAAEKVFNPQEQERQEKIRQEKLKRNKSYKVEVICEECGKVLTSTLGYKHHMELHRNPKSHDIIKCSVCEQDFMREQALKLHQCRHHAKELNLTPIPCPTCQQLYPDNSVLSEHIRLAHERIKSCVCEQCGAEFLRESQLSRHMLRHGERTCPSSFWHQRELDVHVRRKHTPYDLRPHVCNVCSRGFHVQLYCIGIVEFKLHGQRLTQSELEDARVLTSNTASSSSRSTSIKEEAGAISTQTLSCSNDVDLTSQYTIS